MDAFFNFNLFVLFIKTKQTFQNETGLSIPVYLTKRIQKKRGKEPLSILTRTFFFLIAKSSKLDMYLSKLMEGAFPWWEKFGQAFLAVGKRCVCVCVCLWDRERGRERGEWKQLVKGDRINGNSIGQLSRRTFISCFIKCIKHWALHTRMWELKSQLTVYLETNW